MRDDDDFVSKFFRASVKGAEISLFKGREGGGGKSIQRILINGVSFIRAHLPFQID